MAETTDAERLAEIRNGMRGRTRYENQHERADEFLLRLLDEAPRQAVNELEQRLWSVIDRDGLGNVPSDIVGAVAILVARDRAAQSARAGAPEEAEAGAEWQRRRYEQDHKDLCDVLYRDKEAAVAFTAQSARATALAEAAELCAAGAGEAWSRDMQYGGEIIEARIRSLAQQDNGGEG